MRKAYRIIIQVDGYREGEFNCPASYPKAAINQTMRAYPQLFQHVIGKGRALTLIIEEV